MTNLDFMKESIYDGDGNLDMSKYAPVKRGCFLQQARGVESLVNDTQDATKKNPWFTTSLPVVIPVNTQSSIIYPANTWLQKDINLLPCRLGTQFTGSVTTKALGSQK